MRRILIALLASPLALALAACDTNNPEPEPQPADAEPQPADAEPEPSEVEPYDDDTIGVGGVIRATAGDDSPAEVADGAAVHYDLSRDAGGFIGHYASGLAHDEALASSKTAAELAKLAGEEDKSASDDTLCGHAWTKGFVPSYPDKGEEPKDGFSHDCKAEIDRERVRLGVEIFTQHGACLLAANDLAGIDVCDAAEQEAEDELHAHPHGDQPEEKLCTAAVEQLSILISRDMLDEPELLEILNEHIDQIKDDAKLACRDEGTTEEIQCIMKAHVLVDLEAC